MTERRALIVQADAAMPQAEAPALEQMAGRLRSEAELSRTPKMLEALCRRARAGGVLSLSVVVGLVAALFFSNTAATLTGAAIRFDESLLAILNRFARTSWRFDMFVRVVSDTVALQGGVMVALFWWTWFAAGEAPVGLRKREIVISSLVGVYVTVCLALVLRAALPFRPRPLHNPALAFDVPYGALATWTADSSSFPSGHATIFFALATGLWSISATLGLLGVVHALIIDSLPRMYLGLHYPTDVLGGAVLAIATILSVNAILLRRPHMQRFLVWSQRHPAAFYGLFFLLSLEIAAEFPSVRGILHHIGAAHVMRLGTH